MKKNVFVSHEKIHDKLDFFDFEESYFKMCKKFRNLSLFSVCLHVLTCKRSCEKIASYCRYCSRVRHNEFFDLDKFQDLIVHPKPNSKDDYSFLNGKFIDLDVYLNRPAYFGYPNQPYKYKCCCYMEVLSHAEDLLAYFRSIPLRMYLNYAMEHFSELILTIKLTDEKFVVEQILKCTSDLLYNFFDTNCFL